MEKINVVVLGGCAAADILKSNSNYINLYNIKLWLGSVSRQTATTGKVASKLEDEAFLIHNKAKDTSDQYGVDSQIDWVVKKWRTPNILLANLPENSVVIFDPAYELTSFYFDGNEIFDVFGAYHQSVRKYMPEWFNLLVDKNTLRFDCGITEIARFQHRAIVNFMKSLDQMNIPAIAVDNIFTRKIYDPATNSVADAIPQWNSRMVFQHNRSNELAQYEYANDLISRFYEIFRSKVPSNFKLFSPDVNKIYADLNHPYGYHPAHLHHTCRQPLNIELSALIVEVLADHKKRQSIVLSDPNKKFLMI